MRTLYLPNSLMRGNHYSFLLRERSALTKLPFKPWLRGAQLPKRTRLFIEEDSGMSIQLQRLTTRCRGLLYSGHGGLRLDLTVGPRKRTS